MVCSKGSNKVPHKQTDAFQQTLKHMLEKKIENSLKSRLFIKTTQMMLK